MKPNLMDRSIRHAIQRLKKGRGTGAVAEGPDVTGDTSKKCGPGASGPEGRTYSAPQASRLQAVRVGDPNSTGGSRPQAEGIVRTAKRLHKKGHDTGRCRAYGTKSAGLATDSPAKSKQQKWMKYGRTYSNIMWRTAWHIVEDPRMRELNPVAYTDGVLRDVTGPRHSGRPPRRTGGGAALLQTICRFSVPATICPIADPALWAGAAARSRPVPESRPYLRTDYHALALG